MLFDFTMLSNVVQKQISQSNYMRGVQPLGCHTRLTGRLHMLLTITRKMNFDFTPASQTKLQSHCLFLHSQKYVDHQEQTSHVSN